MPSGISQTLGSLIPKVRAQTDFFQTFFALLQPLKFRAQQRSHWPGSQSPLRQFFLADVTHQLLPLRALVHTPASPLAPPTYTFIFDSEATKLSLVHRRSGWAGGLPTRNGLERISDRVHALTCHRYVISWPVSWQPQRLCQPLAKVLEKNVSPSGKSFFTSFQCKVSPETLRVSQKDEPLRNGYSKETYIKMSVK